MCNDLLDSPNSKQKFKNISKDIKELEKSPSCGFYDIVLQTFKLIKSVPQKIHWRIYLELADLAKRESKFGFAGSMFKIVVSIQPYAYQGWLEYSKMEEECGNYEQSRKIIQMGLKLNPLSENLFTKAVKLEDRAPNGTERVREMVERIRANREATIDKTWRIYLEAALFEGRMGNRKEARALF